MSPRHATRPRSLRRGLVALVAIGGVAAGVSACDVRPGAAAFVGNDRISESDVSPYVSGPDTVTPSTAPQQSPRNFVVGVLVLERLWTDYLSASGGVPTDAQLTASREAALAGQSATAPTDAQLRDALVQIGVASSFAPTYTHQAELQYFVTQKATAAGVASQADFSKLIVAKTPRVRLSPRYGTWNAGTLQIDGSTPGYLQLSGSTGT